MQSRATVLARVPYRLAQAFGGSSLESSRPVLVATWLAAFWKALIVYYRISRSGFHRAVGGDAEGGDGAAARSALSSGSRVRLPQTWIVLMFID